LESWEKPLNLLFHRYDWKIGIAIISSFAARSFVGTLATIYSVGGSDNEVTIKNKMAAEINRNWRKYSILPLEFRCCCFMLLPMQCALAVTKRNQFLKWPVGQLIFMSGFAYVAR
jgi:ferrous iron transport protein B